MKVLICLKLLCSSFALQGPESFESIEAMQGLYLDTLSEDSGRRKMRKKQQKMKFSLSFRALYVHLNSCLLIYQVTL